MRRGAVSRAVAALSLALAAGLATAACDLAAPVGPTPPRGSTPKIEASPSPDVSVTPGGPSPTPAPPSGSATPGPLPTPEQYVVQRGDTLTRIARQFGITVAQLLAANPQVKDPNTIRFGYPLTIPPRDSLAVMYRGGGGLIDATSDVTDPDGQLTQSPGYADLERFTARFEGSDLVLELDGITAPPPIDPDGEELRYQVELDVTGDLEPDYQVTASNALVDAIGPDAPLFGLSLLDRRTKAQVTGPGVAGSVSIVEKRLVIRLALGGIGDPQQLATVALVQRDFFPDGRASPDTVETTIDRMPDQQWPRANPRWLVITRAP